MSDKNIFQRLNAAREKVAYLQKDANVQGYKAITHDAVTSAVRDPFIEHGIMPTISLESSNTEIVGKTKNDNQIIRYEGAYKIKFINIDNPDDHFTIVIESHANDHGDKAPGKAMSYAMKYALLKVLNIETGESEESRIDIAQSQKPEILPGDDRWDKAKERLINGKITMSFILDKFDMSKKNIARMTDEVKEDKNA